VLISLENCPRIDPNFHQNSCSAQAMMAANLAKSCVLHFDWSHLVNSNYLPMSPMNYFWLTQNCSHFAVPVRRLTLKEPHYLIAIVV
jgi:hypothetical protein